MTRPEYLLGLYEKSMPNTLTLPEKLAEAGAAGYDYLELSIDETDEKLARLEWTPAQRAALADAARAAGVPIKSICLSGHRRYPLGDPDPAARDTGLDIMGKAVRLAAELGVRVIQLAGYDVYYKDSTPETVSLFGEGLALSAEMAAKEGVTLAFETMETPFMDTVEKAMRWVREVNSPWLQVYPDSGNLNNAALLHGADVLADLQTGRGHLSALHLKETKPGVYRELPYGEGKVDFTAMAREALRLGVRLFVGEFWYTGDENWREILRANNAFLRAALAEAEAAM